MIGIGIPIIHLLLIITAMKKITFSLISLLGLLNFSSCRKIFDYVKHDAGKGTATSCRVDQVSFWRFDENKNIAIYDTGKVTYNALGYPVSLLYTSGGLDRNHWNNKAFKYDKRCRLVSYLDGAKPGFDFGTYWNNYYYINDTLIIDSVFGNAHGNFLKQDRPTMVTDGDDPTYVWAKTIKLDGYGRIIEVNEGGAIAVYTYTTAGNRQQNGYPEYTAMLNIKQTSKTWMFIAEDYSINTPVSFNGPQSFNSQKLPVGNGFDLDFFTFGTWSGFNEGISRDLKISYICL